MIILGRFTDLNLLTKITKVGTRINPKGIDLRPAVTI